MAYKKIIIFVQYFYPGFMSGGPSKSVFNLAQKLSAQGAKLEIVTLNKETDQRTYNKSEILEFLNNNQINYEITYVPKLSFKTILKIYKNSKDSVWVLNSFFNLSFSIFITVILKFLNHKRITVFLFPRGEFDKGALTIKPLKKKLYIFFSRIFKLYSRITVLGSTEEEIKYIKKSRIHFKNYIIQGNIPSQITINNDSFLKQRKENFSTKRFVFASRITEKKNLDFFLNCLKIFDGEIILDIYGPIRDKAYWEKCRMTISELDTNIHVTYKGEYDPKNLSKIFANAHWFILPTLGENFGHIIFESCQHGVPFIITKDVTPWDSFLGVSSLFLPLEEESWINSLKYVNKMKWDEYQLISNNLIAFSKNYLIKDESFKIFLIEANYTKFKNR